MFPKDFDPNTPIYLQIMEAIQRNLARGELRPGDRIPPVRQMASKLVVNPNTVQRAYQGLEHLGLVVIRRGLGTFVTDRKDIITQVAKRLATTAACRYLKDMAALGFSLDEAATFLAESRRGERVRRKEES
ncbi:MAG TPA: GntR family transcriptional regulator [bacterium]|nr:GntR family transcriptional regulator [bacterium]